MFMVLMNIRNEMVELCQLVIRIKKHAGVSVNLGSSKPNTVGSLTIYMDYCEIIGVDAGLKYYFTNHLLLFGTIHYMLIRIILLV